MKASVDREGCTGCGMCMDICPEVFDWEGDSAKVIADPVPEDAEDCAQEAADSCPVEVITIT